MNKFNSGLGETCPICQEAIKIQEIAMPLSLSEDRRKYPNIFYGCQCFEGTSKSEGSAKQYYIEGMNSLLNLESPKIFTQAQVDEFIRHAVTETMFGLSEWFEKETTVVDKTTRKEIENCELDKKPDSKSAKEYIWPRLEKFGMKFIFNDDK